MDKTAKLESYILTELINETFLSLKSIENGICDYNNSLQEVITNAKNTLVSIQNKLNDSRFFVGIAGEFSCGKSTFINAFLETRRLVEAPTPCTTCAGTVIEYADYEDVIITYQNGSRRGMYDGYGYNRHTSADDFLTDITTDEEKAKTVREVLWRVPLPVLQNGLCLVDTPGVNSTNERHTEAAKEILARCDAIIILTNLNSPLSESLCKFISNIAGKSAENCIIIGTYKDLLSEKNLSLQGSSIEKKLEKKFGRAVPFFCVSAFKALEELEGTPGDNLTEFRQFREHIRHFLERKRIVIQSKKISSMLSELIAKLNTELNAQKEKFAEDRYKFQKSVISENDASWSMLINSIIREFNSEASDIFSDTWQEMDSAFDKFLSEVKWCIDLRQSKDRLEKYMSSGIKHELQNLVIDLNNISGKAEDSIKELGRKKHNDFLQVFNRRKSSLVSDSLLSSKDFSAFFNNLHTQSIGSIDIDFTDWFASGFITCSLSPIDMLLDNPVSFVIDFIMSFFESLDDKKKEAFEKIFTQIYHAMCEVKENLRTSQSDLTAKYKNILNRLMADQLAEYKSIAAKINEQLKNNALKLEAKEKAISMEAAKLAVLKGKADAYLESLSENQYSDNPY